MWHSSIFKKGSLVQVTMEWLRPTAWVDQSPYLPGDFVVVSSWPLAESETNSLLSHTLSHEIETALKAMQAEDIRIAVIEQASYGSIVFQDRQTLWSILIHMPSALMQMSCFPARVVATR